MRALRRRSAVAALAATGLTVPALVLGSSAAADDERIRPGRLVRAVTLDGSLAHLRALQQIADVNGGQRAAGSTGHAASAGYVAGQLQAAGYDVEYSPFEFPYFEETTAPELVLTTAPGTTFVAGEDFVTATYSGSGDVTAAVVAVDLVLPPGEAPNTSTSGCEAEDFAGFPAGSIALLQRGTCAFADKAANAEAAGAVAAIVFNEGQPPTEASPEDRTILLNGTLGAPGTTIPVLTTTFALGEALAAAEAPVVRVAASTVSETRTTYNVIAQTPGGRTDNVVVAGAHLDSVPEGAGMNDNASGSSALLEVALQLAEQRGEPRNAVRFAWWSAEEFGLLGAQAYVDSLSSAQLGDIALYLNFDMVASPNFGRFVYDGDDSDATGAPAGPAGSGAVEDVFEAFFAERDLPTRGTDFDGRSDYGPFITAGIPSGGLFTGAEGIKTEEEAELFGGTAGVAYDVCYHQACDTSRNVSNEALDQNADAIAYAVATFANGTEAVNDRARTADQRSGAASLAPQAEARPEAHGHLTR